MKMLKIFLLIALVSCLSCKQQFFLEEENDLEFNPGAFLRCLSTKLEKLDDQFHKLIEALQKLDLKQAFDLAKALFEEAKSIVSDCFDENVKDAGEPFNFNSFIQSLINYNY